MSTIAMFHHWPPIARRPNVSPSPKTMRPGFTLVELLVAIGIIAILIALLLPALAAAWRHADKVQEQSTMRGLLQACEIYAQEQRAWPIGNRNGPGSTATAGDDLRWIYPDTFAYFLSTIVSPGLGDAWKQGALASPPVQVLTDSMRSRLSCLSEAQDALALSTEVGRIDAISGPSFTGTMLGFNYWANRDPAIGGQIYDDHGQPVGEAYKFIANTGTAPTSQVLLTCPNYAGPYFGCELPHCGASGSFVQTQATAFAPVSPLVQEMNGMNMGYADGHVEWRAQSSLWSMNQGGWEWLYFDEPTR